MEEFRYARTTEFDEKLKKMIDLKPWTENLSNMVEEQLSVIKGFSMLSMENLRMSMTKILQYNTELISVQNRLDQTGANI